MPRSRLVNPDTYMDFIRLENHPQLQSPLMQLFEHPGIDGLGAIKMGKRGKPFELIGFRDFLTAAGAISDLEALKADSVGQVCEIYDSAENHYINLLCLELDIAKPVPCGTIVGGLVNNSRAVCSCRIVMVHLGA